MCEKLFQAIDGSKVTPVGEIPAGMLKVTLDTHLKLTTKIVNLSFENWCFPDDWNFQKLGLFSKKEAKKENKQTNKRKNKKQKRW